MEDTCREKAPPSEGGLSGGPPATHGPGQKSLMVPILADEWVVVGRSLPRWRTGSIEKGQKQVGGICRPSPPAAACCPMRTSWTIGSGPRAQVIEVGPGNVRSLLARQGGGVGGP
jgi:hypothetical protein